MPTKEARIFTIDIFRAITMLLMIFVNDFWTLNGVPVWLEHAASDQDFLGFSDVIFPSFLFIVGMSVPYAIRNRIAKGDSHIKIIYHIILRSIALLVMGVFIVNVDTLNEEVSGLSRGIFQILMVIGFFLIWNVYPKSSNWKKYLFAGFQLVGVLILAFLFIHFRGGEHGDERMSPQWWGILGLIGWTYLITALIYLFARKSVLILVLIWLAFTVINIAEHAGWFRTPVPGGGAFQGFAFAGILASLMLDNASISGKQKILPFIYFGVGIMLLGLGIIFRNFFIISKIQTTPTWVFLCNGISFVFLGLLYFLVDVKNKANWFNFIKPAGTSTLTAYLIPYIYYSLAVYFFTLPLFLKTGTLGLIKSLIYAFVIIGITAVLGKLRIKLKI